MVVVVVVMVVVMVVMVVVVEREREIDRVRGGPPTRTPRVRLGPSPS